MKKFSKGSSLTRIRFNDLKKIKEGYRYKCFHCNKKLIVGLDEIHWLQINSEFVNSCCEKCFRGEFYIPDEDIDGGEEATIEKV